MPLLDEQKRDTFVELAPSDFKTPAYLDVPQRENK